MRDRFALAAFAAAVVTWSFAVSAAERTWTDGAGDGLWSSAGNWADNALPATGDTVVFSGTPRTVTLSGSTPSLAGVSFSGSGTWTLAPEASSKYHLYLQGEEATIDVAGGTSVNIAVRTAPSANNATIMKLTGAGAIVFSDYLQPVSANNYFRGIDVAIARCTCQWADHSDGIRIADSADSYIDVRAGAALYVTAANMTCNWARYRVAEGGLLDLCGKNDTVGGFCGAGTVTNVHAITLQSKYPAEFSGRIYSAVTQNSSLSSFGTLIVNACVAKNPQVIAGTDTLAYADVGFASVTNATGADAVETAFRFAPGVGTYRVRAFQYNDGIWTNHPFALQDSAGEPITLEFCMPDDSHKAAFAFTGPGSLRYCGTDASVYRVFIDSVNAFTGTFEVTNTVVRIGSLNPYAALWTPRAYAMAPGAEIHDETVTDGVVYPSVRGGLLLTQNVLSDASRTVCVTSAVDTTLQMNNAAFGETLVLRDGFATNVTFDIRKNDTLEIADGAVVSDSVVNLGNGGGLAQVVLSGGFTTNLYFAQREKFYFGRLCYTGGTDAKPPKPTRITGGTHFLDGLYGNYYNSYVQTGGDVTVRYTGDEGQSRCSNIYYRITGGTLCVDSRLGTNNKYPRGFGFEATGAGTKVIFRPISQYVTRIASDGGSHTWRVADGAEIVCEKIPSDTKTVSFGTQGTSVATTGLVEVAEGGTLSLDAPFSNTGRAASGGVDDSLLAWVRTDGGTVRFRKELTMGVTDSMHWWTVGAKGVKFVSEPDNGNTVCFNPALTRDPALGDGEADGGLDVTVARGAFQFNADSKSAYRGPTAFHGGKIQFLAGMTLGSGDVFFDRAPAYFATAGDYALATGAGSRLTFTPGAYWQFSYAGSSVTVGAADGVADLVRTNRGVLFVTKMDQTVPVGTADGVRVKLGDAPECVNGLSTVPVVAVHAGPAGNDRRSVELLGYDAANGFVPATNHLGLADAAATDVVAQEHAVTLTEDVHAHALQFQSFNGDASAVIDLGGHTLTLGDGTHPAMLALNHDANGGSRAQIKNGTLAFGASEGVIVTPFVYYGYEPAEISATVTGTGGLTLAPLPYESAGTYKSAIRLSAANAYTGGTEVHGLVWASDCGAFGTGPVTVRRCAQKGGSVCFETAGTVANDFTLAGDGAYVDASSGNYPYVGPAALNSIAGNRFTGTVTLAEDASVCAGFGSAEMVLAGRVTGPGRLAVVPQQTTPSCGFSMPVVLEAANDHAGGTAVSNRAWLAVREAGSLGTGPVHVDGTLDVDVATARAFGALSGTGTVRILGAGAVTFASTDGFTGTIQRFGGTVDMNGEDTTTTLGGSENWTNGGTAATLTSDNATDALWTGTLGTGIDLVKTGAGDLNVGTDDALNGAVTVREGTLRFGGYATAAPVANGLKVHIDATRADTIETNETGYVTRWADADGRNYAFCADGTHESPQVRGDRINGLAALWCEGDHTRMVGTTVNWCAPKQVFVVFNRAAANAHNGSNWSCAGILGWSTSDSGLRFGNTIGTKWGDTNWPGNGDDTSYRVNGEEKNVITAGQTDVHALTFADFQKSYSYPLAIGDYWISTGNSSGYNRAFCGLFCEMLVYDRKLTDDEVALTEAYLSDKWRSAHPPVAAVAPGASVTVDEGATLDLNGASVTLTDLVGEGTVANSSETVSRITMAAESSVSHLTLDLGGNIVLWLNGGTLDLGGRTVSVHKVGGRGQVVNGTLTADINTLNRGLVLYFH